MRQDAAPIDVNLIPDRHIIAQHAHVLQPRPLANDAVPAHDGALDPRVVFDLAPRQQHAPLQAHAVADDDVGADGDVGADAAVFADLGRRVDEDVAAVDERFRRRGQRLGVLLRERGEVEAGAGEEVLRLANVHPEALEVHGVQLPVRADCREGFLLDGRGAQVDAAQHRRVEDVDARVDAVADELDGFLDEAIDAGGVVGFVHHHTVFGGFFDLGDDDGALVAVGFVEFGELFEGVVADDVGVENEEGGGVFAEGFLGQFEGPGGAEGFGFDGEFDVDVVFVGILVGQRVSVGRAWLEDVFKARRLHTSFKAFSITSGR